MLNLLLGRAGTGKTDIIMNEIKHRMSKGESGILLIVPEQYSHDAERQLCAVCGDRLSLHAEVLSFSRLYNTVLSETGGAASGTLNASGQILALHRALESVASDLMAFDLKRMRTELLERLLEAIKEFKSYNISPQMLENAAIKASNPLAGKLCDLALIYSAYDALVEVHGGDSAERLDILADKIGESSVGDTGHIYFDGFIDFTAQELSIIKELLLKKAEITVCLTCDLEDKSEVFVIPRKTVAGLHSLASECNVKVSSNEYKENLTIHEGTLPQSPELKFLEEHLFDDAPPKYKKESKSITIYAAQTRYNECEYAAYEVLRLIREGYRWRDIGVMARNWEDYSSICENVFEKYDIPYFSGGKADILSKPPISILDSALEIVTFGYEYKSIFKYLKSGLIDISTDNCALLENYVLKWQIRGTIWEREWKMSPGGYSSSKDDEKRANRILGEINSVRQGLVEPLISLRESIKGESTVELKLKGLYRFLLDIKLPESLDKKAKELDKRGEKRLADEYLQLWDIIIAAMEQMFAIIGNGMILMGVSSLYFNMVIGAVVLVSFCLTGLEGLKKTARKEPKQ